MEVTFDAMLFEGGDVIRTDSGAVHPRRHNLFGLLVGITGHSTGRLPGEKFASDFNAPVGLTGVDGPRAMSTDLFCDTSDLEKLNLSLSRCARIFSGAYVDLLLRCLRGCPVLG